MIANISEQKVLRSKVLSDRTLNLYRKKIVVTPNANVQMKRGRILFSFGPTGLYERMQLSRHVCEDGCLYKKSIFARFEALQRLVLVLGCIPWIENP